MMKRGWSALAAIAMLAVLACQEKEPPQLEVALESKANVETYQRGEIPMTERTGMEGCYNGTISVSGPEGQMDTRPLILCVRRGEVDVWINSEIYPTAVTSSTRSGIQANILLANDEVMSLAGDYVGDRITGKVVRSNGASGVFEVSSL